MHSAIGRASLRPATSREFALFALLAFALLRATQRRNN
jgi:hypothetical protein